MRTDKYNTNDRQTDIQTGNLTPRPIGDLSSSKLTVFTIVLAGRYLGGSWRPIFEYMRQWDEWTHISKWGPRATDAILRLRGNGYFAKSRILSPSSR